MRWGVQSADSAHLTLPVAEATGPLPLRPKGREGRPHLFLAYSAIAPSLPLRGGEGRGEVGIPERRQRPTSPSPLAGGVEGGGVFEVVEEGAGGLQVGGVEAFGEPAEDRGEQGDHLLRAALLAAQAGEARRGAQFPLIARRG